MSGYGVQAVRAAGVSSVVPDEGTKYCLNVPERPATPEKIKKFRKSCFKPGDRHIHYGTADDVAMIRAARSKLSASDQTFGLNSKSSDHINDAWANGPQSQAQRLIEANKERMYRGLKSKPLGKSISQVKNVSLPGHVLKKEYAFGIVGAQKANESFAKPLIYPENHEDTTEKDKIYTKSHGTIPPGNQKSRSYDWGGINSTTHRFGKVDVAGLDMNTASCFKKNISNPYAPDTYIISKNTFDYQLQREQLGKPKNLGQSSPDGITFGTQSSVAKLGKDAWGAAECIRGTYTTEEQLPDNDLGRAIKRGTRNFNIDGRTFGCPSLRTDRPVPKRRSVADNNNYGTDPTAQELLAPSHFVSEGVDNNDFFDDRGQEEIRDIFQNIGYNFTDEQFQCIWWRAATAKDFNGDGIVSVHEFRAAMNEYLDDTKKGVQPQWWAAAKNATRN